GPHPFGYLAQKGPLLEPGLADHPLGGPVGADQNYLLDPAPSQGVVVGDAGIGRQQLAGEPAEKALFEFADHALDLALGLGPVGLARLGDHAQQGRHVDPFRCQNGPPVAGCTDAEDGVTVGEDLPGGAAEVLDTAQQSLEAGRTSLVGGEADRRRPAAAEDGCHREHLHRLSPEGEDAEVRPVSLGLFAGVGFEADLRIDDLSRPELSEAALEGRVAALVPVLATGARRAGRCRAGSDRRPAAVGREPAAARSAPWARLAAGHAAAPG